MPMAWFAPLFILFQVAKGSHIYSDWNPWHGCTKVSPGCKYCYVYRQDAMYGAEVSSSVVRKTANFALPLGRKRDKSFKIAPGSVVFTCFTSDFLVEGADPWRADAWAMMRERSDCMFFFFTKRIDRLANCVPDDWGRGYPNVVIGCTIENQALANFRLPIFLDFPIAHRAIIVAPLLGQVSLEPYLDACIEEVAVSGESGTDARVCDYNWVLDIRRQCLDKEIPFRFHQTGAKLLKDGKLYRIPRRFQIAQARKAGIDYKIGKDGHPL